MEERLPIESWLPITKKEVEKRGWEELDVILISGDAYVDHPAFGTAVVGKTNRARRFSDSHHSTTKLER